MYKADHSDVLKEYEIEVTITKNKIAENPLVDENFNVISTNKEVVIKIAYFNVKNEDVNEDNGFKSGDLKVYCRLNQESVLEVNDSFKSFNGSTYIIKQPIPCMYADYLVFLGRRDVNDSVN
ncbi:hypothetical protein [uncultured Cetobacterium sp.]|uniref:hypothetical protein n=1 Tax=uncultured Cetobacterium sp. TaxID=527638 RepID=UPI002632EA96|nr:hypothetical protein [uncultured Cetobacterium sp.]